MTVGHAPKTAQLATSGPAQKAGDRARAGVSEHRQGRSLQRRPPKKVCRFLHVGCGSPFLGPVRSRTVVRLRSLLFLVPLLMSEGSLATAQGLGQELGREPLGFHETEPPRVVVVPALVREPVEAPPDEEEEVEAELEDAPTPLHEVQWTVMQGESRDMLASRWGMMERHLVALNPELKGLAAVPAGLRLRVFAHDDERPTRSIGAPNKGRLQHGLPMPEGPYWQLRERRTRTYGATNAIGACRRHGAWQDTDR